MSKLFTIAGTSVLKGIATFRFATGTIEKRAWVLKHNGHTNVALVMLPNEMDKMGAIAWLQAQGIGNGAVLPNAAKAPTAVPAAEVVLVKTAEEIEAEEKEARKAAFLAKMAAGREAARAKKAAQQEEAAQQDETVYVEPTALALKMWA